VFLSNAARLCLKGRGGVKVVKRFLLIYVCVGLIAAINAPVPAVAASRICDPWHAGCRAVVKKAVERPRLLAPIVGGKLSALAWSYSELWKYKVCDGTSCTPVLGSYTAWARIDLSGRQSDWRQRTTVETGPALWATHTYNCVDDNGILPNTSCTGGWRNHTCQNAIPRGSTCGTGPFTVTLQDNATYWWDFEYYISPNSGPYEGVIFRTPTLSSYHFECTTRSGSDCRFP